MKHDGKRSSNNPQEYHRQGNGRGRRRPRTDSNTSRRGTPSDHQICIITHPMKKRSLVSVSSSSSSSLSSSTSSGLFATILLLVATSLSLRTPMPTKAFSLPRHGCFKSARFSRRQHLQSSFSRIHPLTKSTTTLHAMDSRQLRFLGYYSKNEEKEAAEAAEAEATRSSFQPSSSASHPNQYTDFVREYVASSSFWASLMAGTTRDGILSQSITRTTMRQKVVQATSMSVAASRAVDATDLGGTTDRDRKTMRFSSTLSSSSSTSSSSNTRVQRDSTPSDYNVDKNKGGNDVIDKTKNSGSYAFDKYPFEPKRGYGPYIALSPEERELFQLLRRAREEMKLNTTLRVAGGWVRDKLLATPEFTRSHPTTTTTSTSASTATMGGGGVQRLTSKYKLPFTATAASMGRQGGKVIGSKRKDRSGNSKSNESEAATLEYQPPVDIDIALDDMLGREFSEHLNQYLGQMGEQTHSVGVILQNPEKSKHLETATMKVGSFWIDFVNLRAEEYTQDSRIPELMRIGSPAEDSFRRDLTINSLFYNVNNGQVEDWTGRGFDDLRRGVVSTPLAPLTTLLDDPLRALRSVRFAARLRFTMDDSLIDAAMDGRVRQALAEKVSRERIGCEVDLMLRSPDPVGAMRLLINLNLAQTVFPIEKLLLDERARDARSTDVVPSAEIFHRGLDLLSTNYEHFEDCKAFPPVWCQRKDAYNTFGRHELTLCEDDDARRYLWYASFLKPFYDYASKIPEGKKSKRQGKSANRSVVCKLLVDELKRPTREAEAVEKIVKGAKEFRSLMDSGCDLSAVSVLLSGIRVEEDRRLRESSLDVELADDSNPQKRIRCSMNGKTVYSATEQDPVWQHSMDFRLQCSKILRKVGPLWRAALFLAMSEQMNDALQGDLEYVIEGDIFDETQEDLRQREIDRYDALATAMQRLGLIGVWDGRPILDGGEVKKILPGIPKGPAFRVVMDEQEKWNTLHPGAGAEFLARHLIETFPEYTEG